MPDKPIRTLIEDQTAEGQAVSAAAVPQDQYFGDPEVRAITLDALSFDNRLQELPEHRRLAALFGITKDFEPRLLPGSCRACVITVPRARLPEAKAILQDLALPCNYGLFGDPNDSTASLTYVVPHPLNVSFIMGRFADAGISGQIVAAEKPTLVARIGADTLSLHSFLNDPYSGAFEEADRPSVKIIGKNGEAKGVPGLPLAHDSPVSFDSAYATIASLAAAREQAETPRSGYCVYLMIDQNLLKEQSPKDPKLNKLMDMLSTYAKSPDFSFASHNGFLMVIGTSSGAASLLALRMQRMYRGLSDARIFIGEGDVEQHGADQICVKGYPSAQSRSQWNQYCVSGGYVTDGVHGLITDPSNRNSKYCAIEVRKVDGTDLWRVIFCNPRVSLHMGGPERLIGYETERGQLAEALTNTANKLTVLKGTAGMGKSRLLKDALCELPNSIVCSAYSSGRNLQGQGLVSIAEQIAAKVKDEPESIKHEGVSALLNFDSKSEKERLDTAQQSPARVTEMCFSALKALNTCKTVWVLDDMHYVDRFSGSYITGLASRYMTETDGKVVMAMRPESKKVYESPEVQELKKSMAALHGDAGVCDIELRGLDFSNPEIAREFAFYSLPVVYRMNPATNLPRTLGPWYAELGAKAKGSPFRMKYFMDVILKNPEYNLEITGEVINVRRDTIERLKLIETDSDMAVHYCEMIEALAPEQKLMLQCLALMDGAMSAKQAAVIGRNVLGITDEAKIENLMKGLVDYYYISATPARDDPDKLVAYNLEHDLMKAPVVSSIRDPQERLRLSAILYQSFKDDEPTHIDKKFLLAHNIALDEAAPQPDDPFWAEYMGIGRATLDDAIFRNSVKRAYNLAENLLEARPMRAAAFGLSQGAVEQVGAAERLAIDALFALADNALSLGKFKEFDSVAERLIEIHAHNPEAVDINRVYILQFEKAYIRDYPSKYNDMRMIYDQKLMCGVHINQGLRRIMLIKLNYVKGLQVDPSGFDEAEFEFCGGERSMSLETYTRDYEYEHDGRPAPDYIEAFRLAWCRCPFEKLHREIKLGVDGDVLMQPGVLNLRATQQMFEVTEKLDVLHGMRKRYAASFKPYSELALVEQSGHVEAFLGNYEKAIEHLTEACRLSQGMEIYKPGARAAKLKGDIYMLQSVARVSEPASRDKPGRLCSLAAINKEFVLKAIKAYTEEGMVALANMSPDEHYQFSLRVQRVRAVGFLAISCCKEMDSATEIGRERLKEELAPNILKAIEDFKHLNEHFASYANDPEVQYYVMSYMGHILHAARRFGIEVPQEIFNPDPNFYMARKFIETGANYAAQNKLGDAGTGEIARKSDGFTKLLAEIEARAVSACP